MKSASSTLKTPGNSDNSAPRIGVAVEEMHTNPREPSYVGNTPSSTPVPGEAYLHDEMPDALSVTGRGEEEEVIKTTPYRYLIMIFFAVFGFANQLQYVAYATVIRETEIYYNISAFDGNVLSFLIPIVYVVGVVPGCYVYNKVGLRWGMIIGAGTNGFASLLKLIAVWAPKFGLLVVAQIFVGIGQILFLSLPSLIAGIWFPPNERTVATALAEMMGFAGMAVGMFYSPYVVNAPDHNTKKEWAGLMGSQFGLSVLILILIGIFARDKPKYRPSQTSTEDYKLPLLRFLKAQCCDLNFVLLTISFGFLMGILTAWAGVLMQVIEPFGIDADIAGALSFAGLMAGSANCCLVGYFVDRTHRYKITAISLGSVTAACCLIITILVKTMTNMYNMRIALYILVPMIGFLSLPIVPVTMELAVELSYPCPETVPSTLVLMSMCFFSFIGMVVFAAILGNVPDGNSTFYCILIVLILAVLGIVGLCCVKENLMRQRKDQLAAEAAEEDLEDNRADLMKVNPNAGEVSTSE